MSDTTIKKVEAASSPKGEKRPGHTYVNDVETFCLASSWSRSACLAMSIISARIETW